MACVDPLTSLALFIWLIIRLIQLVFLAGTVFFSHKKSANSIFQPAYNSSRTEPLLWTYKLVRGCRLTWMYEPIAERIVIWSWLSWYISKWQGTTVECIHVVGKRHILSGHYSSCRFHEQFEPNKMVHLECTILSGVVLYMELGFC
jgi:hypothetical protein